MAKPEIEVFDIQRMTLGDLPFGFLPEIVFRAFIMYIFLLLMMRVMGNRSMTQMSNFEFALLIALGSAVGDPMFYEDVPILHGMIAIIVIIMMQKILVTITEKNKKLEKLIEGKSCCLVRDGVALCSQLEKEKFSVGELFSNLRVCGIENLGEVKAAYIEASGKISVFKYPEAEIKPGLLLTPENIDEGQHSGKAENGQYSCNNCGNTIIVTNGSLAKCESCSHDKWSIAQLKKK